jgi:hypothetical protein
VETLSTLNAVARDEYLNDLVEKYIPKILLYNRWNPLIDTKAFNAEGKAVLEIENVVPISGGFRQESEEVIRGGAHSYGKIEFDVRQLMTVTEVTDETMRKYKNSPHKFGDVSRRYLNHCIRAYQVLKNLQYHGDGTGRLARVSAFNASTGVVTVDNTRADFGWDKCAYIEPGMLVDIYTFTDGTEKAVGCTVTAVNKVAGTFTISGGEIGEDASAPADNDIVFAYKAAEWNATTSAWDFRFGNGIMNLVDDGSLPAGGDYVSGWNGSWSGRTIFGVDRTLYPTLQAHILKADDWGSGTAGTPATWDLNAFTECFDVVEYDGDGDEQISVLLGNQKMERALARKCAVEYNTMAQFGPDGKVMTGIQVPTYKIKGRNVPFIVISSLPDNTIYALDESQIFIPTSETPHWHAMNGTKPWFQTRRDLTYEAWYWGEDELAARTCRGFIRIEDLADDE